jgi:hypothetical protein
VATSLVCAALAGTGIECIASCGIEAYDHRAPSAFRSEALLPGARGIVVAASAGPALWRGFRAQIDRDPTLLDLPHPYDAYVGSLLARADASLAAAGVVARRFDAAFHAPVRLDFVALAELVGLGSQGPFRLLIHETHGPWWALRGAWLVATEVEPPLRARPPCVGCAAPCVGGWERAGGATATPEVRARCIVGLASRYDKEQIDYHYDRAAAIAQMRARL